MAAGVSETTLRFMPDDEMIALVRPGWIGRSHPPVWSTAWAEWWQFHKMNYRIGGPNFIRLPDGGLWASARRYHPDGSTTVLARMHGRTCGKRELRASPYLKPAAFAERRRQQLSRHGLARQPPMDELLFIPRDGE